MKPWQGLILDVVVVVSLTTLAALHVVPGEAVLALLGMLVGARVRPKGGPPSGPSGAAGTSACLALMIGLASFLHFRSP